MEVNLMARRRIFMDSEFTGLHQRTRLVSLGIVSDAGDIFYAESTDYGAGIETVDDEACFREYIKPNLLGQAGVEQLINETDDSKHNMGLVAHENAIAAGLRAWLHLISPTPDSIEVWADCLAYDWVLFCALYGRALDIPENVYYIPFDLCTLLLLKNINPDITREQLAELSGDQPKHNALHDARVLKLCVEKLEKT
jgi:hypothetical protein